MEVVMRRFVLAAFALIVLAACQPEITEDVNPLVGAWRVSELSVESPDTSYTITDVQPSLYMFTERHYSFMRVTGDQPRELFVGDAPVIGSRTPTDAERIAACSAFTANSGTYEVSGSTLTLRPVVAKNPGVMSGVTFTRTIQVMEGMFHLTSMPSWLPDTELRYTLIPAR
jgi:hypothetical protein